MSTYETNYCNTTTDLTFVEPDIDQFDQKRVLRQSWQVDSGSRYVLYNAGYTDQLFADGQDLGSAQASSGAVDTNGEWYYDSDTDALYYYDDTTAPNSRVMEAGRDWATLKTQAVNRASDFVRTYINKPIYPRKGTGVQSESARDYEDIIVRSTAILAVSYLIRPYDKERADEIERVAYDPESKNGYLDLIKDGRIALWNEVSRRQGIGVVRVVSNDSTTTGSIVDTKGTPTVDWDVVKVKINTGGTFSQGSSSSVTFDSWVRDATGLKTSQVADAETIDGGYQSIGRGIYVRFSPGVYVAGDEWEVEISGDNTEGGSALK
jgi:hypothetical protein